MVVVVVVYYGDRSECVKNLRDSHKHEIQIVHCFHE